MMVVGSIFLCGLWQICLEASSKLFNFYLYVRVSRKYYTNIDLAAPNTQLYYINLRVC